MHIFKLSRLFAGRTEVVVSSDCGLVASTKNDAVVLDGACGERSLLKERICVTTIADDTTVDNRTILTQGRGSNELGLGDRGGNMRGRDGCGCWGRRCLGFLLDLRRRRRAGRGE